MRPREPSWPARPDAADAARARLASDLRQRSRALSRPVHSAFAKVPRHVFVPEVAPDAAYRDEAFVIKCGPDGMPVSSSSQPAMMAIMLDQLGLRPGHRVLEIGTGSGYNAAVMAAVVGPRGKVISIDIDPELVTRARANLTAAGYDSVTVICADGGFGDPENAPFDRIIVTAGAWDISPAWLGQVAAGGLLVLPLSVRGIQLSVALRQDDDGDGWRSASSWRCGFVRMLGAFAGPEKVIEVGEPDYLVAQVPDGSAVDPHALQAALAGQPAAEQVLPRPGGLAELGDLDLWLTMSASALDRVTVLAAGSWFPPALLLPAGFLVSHGTEANRLGAAALLPGEPGGRDAASHGQGPGAVIRGFGPGGPALADYLAGLARRWAELGRPEAQNLQLTVWSGGRRRTSSAAADQAVVLKRPSVSIEVGWPG
jgi:protein-L-isoaspartate(D-aspartate) O-methyltransferase